LRYNSNLEVELVITQNVSYDWLSYLQGK